MPRNRDGPRTAVNHIVVTGYEKRRSPSKHYVFIIDITWDNDERYEVFRRYSEFFTLNETLKILFHKPPNKSHDESCSVPLLPKRKFIGRSHIESVAEARLEALNQYCQGLIRLEEKVSKCKQVIAFFSPKIGDKQLPKLRLNRPPSLHPMQRPAGNSIWEEYCVIATFKGDGKKQISAESGDQVILLNKDPSGWWLIERRNKIGWIPASYLKKSRPDEQDDERLGLIDIPNKKTSSPDRDEVSKSPVIDAQEYIAIDSYEAQGPGQISFEEAEVITVLDKMEDGWWFVSKDDEEGWAPCGYLEPLNKDNEEEDIPTSTLDIEKYTTIAPYKAEEEDEVSFCRGTDVEVLQKSLTGWWLIRFADQLGLAPATYLKKTELETEKPLSIATNSDSGFDSGSDAMASFKQVERQRTVRKKRSTKGKRNGKNKSNQPVVIEEDTDDSNKIVPTSRKFSEPLLQQIPPDVQPLRKNSSPPENIKVKGYKPPVSPKPTARSKSADPQAGNKLEVYHTPPRPRQSQINRAWSQNKYTGTKELTEDSDESSDEKPRGRSLFRNNARRHSPHSGSPLSISPITSPQLHYRPLGEPRKESSLSPPVEDRKSSEDSSPMAGPNPFTNQMVDSMLKYILASNDPSLKDALREIITSDPKLMDSLKEK